MLEYMASKEDVSMKGFARLNQTRISSDINQNIAYILTTLSSLAELKFT